MKRIPAQLYQARDFLFRVKDLLDKRRQAYHGDRGFPSFVVTGHSVGGAAAQMQVAATYTRGRAPALNVKGITFAAVGAGSALFNRDKGETFDRRLVGFADGRIINYVREGDGIVYRRNQWFERPSRIGRDRVIAGLDMESIRREEREADGYDRLGGSAGTSNSVRVRIQLLFRYKRNHSLLSYYHRQFATPLHELFPGL